MAEPRTIQWRKDWLMHVERDGWRPRETCHCEKPRRGWGGGHHYYLIDMCLCCKRRVPRAD